MIDTFIDLFAFGAFGGPGEYTSARAARTTVMRGAERERSRTGDFDLFFFCTHTNATGWTGPVFI